MSDLVPAGPIVDAELVDDTGDDMDELIDNWLDAGNKSAHTRTAYIHDVGLWRTWCRGRGINPMHATKVDVDQWIRDLATTPNPHTRKPPAKATLARIVSAVSSLYDYLVDQDYLDAVPIRSSSRPQAPKRSTTIGLSAEETVQLIAEARTYGPRDHAIIDVLLVEGLRVAELADLMIRSYSWNKGRRTLIVIGKGEKRRELVVPPGTRACIDAHLHAHAAKLGVTVSDLDPDSPMFPSVMGGRLPQKTVMRMVQRLAKKAGIPAWSKLSPHSLRHTCVTGMLDAGVPIHVVQEQLGHEDISTTLRYDRARGSIDRSGTGSYEQYLQDVERNMEPAA